MPGAVRDPGLGPALFQQTPLTYLAFVMVVLVAWFLERTPLGLAVRTVGENPAAAEAQGINVTWVRIGAVMAGRRTDGRGRQLHHLVGLQLLLLRHDEGRGWICIALWSSAPGGPARPCSARFCSVPSTPISCDAATAGGGVPYQVFLKLPFVLSILALIVMSRRVAYLPAPFMVPYRKGER